MTLRFDTLPNGFRIVTEHMPGLMSASIGIWVQAGGRHERPEQNGIAHFLEHMAFKGTKTRSPLQIAEAIEDVGGYINAYTSKDMTAYYARVLSADVGLALDVISDIVLNPVFDPREIETERNVILQEIGQTLDTPDDIIFDWLQEVSYPDQPFGRTILGPAKRVGAFSQQDLINFVAQHYGPNQMILSAAGGVDHDEILTKAIELFGHLPRHEPFQMLGADFLGGEKRKVKKLEQAHFTLSFEAPSYRAPDVYAAQIYGMALGGGMSSRLFQKVREENGLCYTIFAQSGAYEDTGQITIYAGTSSEEIASLAQLTVEELKRAPQDMSSAEVERARVQLKAGLLMGLESPSSRAERLARLLAIYDRVPSLDEAIAKIDAVTCQDVREFAANMNMARSAMVLYGPISKAPDLASLRKALAA
ncbi:MAG: peptidase M16 [Rhodobacter sp. BACL10 MAG-120910-bin24]|nr:MAG: peptidase M16 [Rhodobacter sp. BACL10 MAG-120910-bin24]KRP23451.1 MAG: peptidase M16 [Rhodobacter sp. BACL10 MAG-120419-bin15]